MFWNILIAVLIIAVIVLVGLYFWGNKMQARQAEQQMLMDQMAQTVSLLVIDKKKLKLKESGLPQTAIDQAPWYTKRMKFPIVKVKIQNRIMTMIADADVYEILPVKKEAKVVISGAYITAVKSIRGETIKAPEKKKGIAGWFSRFFGK